MIRALFRRPEIPRHRRLALAIRSILLGWLLFQAAPSWAAIAPDDLTRLSGVAIARDGTTTVVRVTTSRAVESKVTELSDPWRLVLDFEHTRLDWKPSGDVTEDPVRDVRGSQLDEDVAQLVIELWRKVPHAVRAEAGGLRVVLVAAPAEIPTPTAQGGSTRDPVPATRPEDSAERSSSELDKASDAVAVASIPSEHLRLTPEGLLTLSAGLATPLLTTGPLPLLGLAGPPDALRLDLRMFHDRWGTAPPSEPPSFRVDTTVSRKGSVGIGDELWNRVGVQASRVDLKTGGRITFFGDLVHPAQQLPYALDWDTPDARSPQALNVGFLQSGLWKPGQQWEYGLRYHSLDSRFDKFASSDLKSDEAGSEAWVGWQAGPLRLRGFASQTWNNLAEDPSRDRTTELLGGVKMELSLPSKTWVSVSYAQGTADRSRAFLSGSQRRQLGELPDASSSWVEKLSASLYHWRETWDVSLFSSYTPSQDADRRDQERVSLSQDLRLTVRPTKQIGSSIVMSVWQEREQWSGNRWEGSTASLSLWYGPFLDGHTLDFWGSYTRGRSNDGYWDSQSVSASATLSRRLGRTALGDASLAVELGCNLYRDAIYSSSSSDEVYGRIVLKVLDF